MLVTGDMEETARLVLMELRDERAGLTAREQMYSTPLREFVPRMRAAHPELDSRDGYEALIPLYKKYMGFDGRERPTHDLDTGRRITR